MERVPPVCGALDEKEWLHGWDIAGDRGPSERSYSFSFSRPAHVRVKCSCRAM